MNPYVIAEAAQGYEGSVDLALLLVRAAAAGRADAVKFQIVYLDDLAEPGYQHAALFEQLELSDSDWARVHDAARKAGLAFYADVFGARAAGLARELGVDGVKIHSTSFFDESMFDDVASWAPRLLLSIGGIEIDELRDFAPRVAKVADRSIVMYGFQAEPTATEDNHLRRIDAVRSLLGVDVGFMDHSAGDGPDTMTLSAMALALGVTVFEKHIGLDAELELEDYVSALPPSAFRTYVESLRRLSSALGSPDLQLRDVERGYRSRAVKRVVAVRPLAAGTVIEAGDVRLSRPARSEGLWTIASSVGRRLRGDVAPGHPITDDLLDDQ